MKSFLVKKSAVPVVLDAGWDSEIWANANVAKVDFAFDRNSDHTPDVQIKMLHDGENICGLFKVEDRYIIARAQQDQDMVCQDSCVEFFVKNPAGEGYFNFEVNCIGTALAAFRRSRTDADHFDAERMACVRRFGSLPHVKIDSRGEGQRWWMVEVIPFALLGLECAPKHIEANFYKCGDKCDKTHFLSWSPIGLKEPNFHCPEFFGVVDLA